MYCSINYYIKVLLFNNTASLWAQVTLSPLKVCFHSLFLVAAHVANDRCLIHILFVAEPFSKWPRHLFCPARAHTQPPSTPALCQTHITHHSVYADSLGCRMYRIPCSSAVNLKHLLLSPNKETSWCTIRSKKWRWVNRITVLTKENIHLSVLRDSKTLQVQNTSTYYSYAVPVKPPHLQPAATLPSHAQGIMINAAFVDCSAERWVSGPRVSVHCVTNMNQHSLSLNHQSNFSTFTVLTLQWFSFTFRGDASSTETHLLTSLFVTYSVQNMLYSSFSQHTK